MTSLRNPPRRRTAMPNTGRLDHRTYRRRSKVQWLPSWPQNKLGYEALRVAELSRHLLQHEQVRKGGGARHPVGIDRPFFFLEVRTSQAARARPSTSTPRLTNSLVPFQTGHVKPTCGFFFSPVTDNRRRSIGIPPSNLVAWRSRSGTTSRAMSAHV